MTLHIQEISFRDFRNYPEFHLEDIQPITVFVGENAVGKTNIIEGIELLTALTSFRHATTQQLLRDSADSCCITTHVTDEYRDLEMQLLISDKKKHYFLNGKKKQINELKGFLPSVLFTPDDLMLVKGSQSIRRNTLDALGSQLSQNYYIIQRDYENVLRHKNKLLKEEASTSLLEAINEMIITCGAQLTCYRSAILCKLIPYVCDFYSKLASSKEVLTAQYIPSWCNDSQWIELQKYNPQETREIISKRLGEVFFEEQNRHRCLVGPQLDKIIFYIDGKDATLFGSQGQQRSLVLAYRFAELAVITDMLHQNPVLLLDDVMSELDSSRREKLIQFIPEQTQVFITTTHLNYFTKDLLDQITPIHLPM